MKENVLIVADDKAVSGLAKSTLQHEGYNVYVALQSEAVSMIDTVKPQLIVIDHTEEQHGGTLCRTMKKSGVAARIPVLLMSPMRELSEMFDQFLADDFIYRPYILRALVDKVSQLLIA